MAKRPEVWRSALPSISVTILKSQSKQFFKHLETCPHLPDWEHAEILKDELSKIGRKTLESSLIEAFPCTNTKAGDVRLARSVALALVEEYLGKKVTWLSLGFEFLNMSCRVECLHFIFIFHLNLHTDEVIYETGLCNKCIYIVSHRWRWCYTALQLGT